MAFDDIADYVDHHVRHHVVQEGDTLESIAKQWYGSESEWPKVFLANRHQVGRGGLNVGNKLRIV